MDTPDYLLKARKALATADARDRVCAREKSERSERSPAADPWPGLLAAAGPLRETLDAFRAQGCALNVVGGRVFFGPYDDFAGCVWRDADEWHAAYAVALAPHEVTLRDLLARLLERIEAEEMAP